MFERLSNLVAPKSTPDEVLAHAFRRVSRGIGYTAILLPLVAWLFGWIGALRPEGVQNSLSHYYYVPVMGDYFVGCLFFIGILFFFFFHSNGKPIPGWDKVHPVESWLMRAAGLLAIGIAIFPTGYPGTEVWQSEQQRPYFENGAVVSPPDWAHQQIGGFTLEYHYVCAVLMFFILAWFTLRVFPRVHDDSSTDAQNKPMPTKLARNRWYKRLGSVILAAIVFIGIGSFSGWISEETWQAWNGTFWGEFFALVAFGFAWLIKGRLFPALNDPAHGAARAR